MKKILLQILHILIYPFAVCYRIIQEAPIIDCDRALIGYSEFNRYTGQKQADPARKASRPVRTVPSFVHVGR